MPSLTMLMDGDSWPDLEAKLGTDQLINAMGPGAKPIQVALLDGGMTSGRPSVTFRIDLADGRTVLTETSLRLFVSAARVFAARYPDLFVGD
jgi:hypothetical protein